MGDVTTLQLSQSYAPEISSVSSTMMTESAPRGIGPPVLTRSIWPRSRGRPEPFGRTG